MRSTVAALISSSRPEVWSLGHGRWRIGNFGYPQAHEHDTERAVRAGLALVEAVPELKTTAGAPLQVRVGIATGIVVVGDLIEAETTQEHEVVGETPNLAARLQALAEPGTVVISSSTHRLTGGLFHYRDLGPVALKGFAETVPVWQALGASAAESRFEAPAHERDRKRSIRIFGCQSPRRDQV